MNKRKKTSPKISDKTPSPFRVESDVLLIILALAFLISILGEFFIFHDWNQIVLITIFLMYIIAFLILFWRDGFLSSRYLLQIKVAFVGARKDLAICGILFLISYCIISFLLMPHGPGLSDDSLNYIATGDNLAHLDEFKQGYLVPVLFTMWPPLYPSMIAVLVKAGSGAEAAAGQISALFFSALMFPMFYLGKRIGNRLLGYSACAITLFFFPFWYVSSWAWSEIPFLFFSLVAILFAIWYLDDTKNAGVWLLFSALFTSLACLTRYMGLTLVVAILFCIIYHERKAVRNLFCRSVQYTIFAGGPIVLWFYRNTVISGYWTGMNRGVSEGSSGTILFDLFSTLFNDAFGVMMTIPSGWFAGTVAVSLLLVMVFIFSIWKTGAAEQYSKIDSGKTELLLPIGLFLGIYFATLILAKTVWKLIDPVSTRLVYPMYPAFILLILALVFLLLNRESNKKVRDILFAATGSLFLIFLVFQAAASIGFSQEIQDGQGFNNLHVEENSPVVRWVANEMNLSTEDVYVDSQVFWFLDYEYRIPAVRLNLSYVLTRPDLEHVVVNVLQTDSRINFILDQNQESPSDLVALNASLTAIARNNNYTYEYLELKNTETQYSIFRIGNQVSPDAKNIEREYEFYNLVGL